MSKEELYYQCHLKDDLGYEQVAWIESRGAKLHKLVEVIEGDESTWWAVVEVYEPPVSKAVLKEKQRMDRASLPSIKG